MEKKIAIMACICFYMGFSQIKSDTIKSVKLDEVTISAQRFEKPKRELSQQIGSISKGEINFQNFQTTADVLQNSGTLAVQKSQQGGGSPIIRGFESNRILLLVDGIRMNNLIYRSGHLQNVLTIDKYSIENIEVLFGPSSTIFGSDALGGAIYMQTKSAKFLSNTQNKDFTGNVIANFSTINNAPIVHFDLNYASNKWASLTSFSFSDYDNLKMGTKQNGSNSIFGLRPYYVETINGIDTMVKNSNEFNQVYSGYTQYDFMQKVLYQQNENAQHSLNVQYTTTSDIPRYDRLTDVSENGDLKYAVWNYGPQERLLTAYQFSRENVFLNTEMNINLDYQFVEESRITRKFGNPNQFSGVEKVSVYGFTTEFSTKKGTGNLIYGIDVYYDTANSTATKLNVKTGESLNSITRYPDGSNNTFRTEGFVSYNNRFSDKTFYNASLRGGYTELNSEINQNFLDLPYTTVKQQNTPFSAAVGIVNNPNKHIKLAFNLSSGYRVPNVDDLSKIFESVPGQIIVPNADLEPEKSVTADFSVSFFNGKKFQWDNTFFITKLYDPIVTDTYTLNGQSEIIFQGEESVIMANQNQGKANIAGFSSALNAKIINALSLYATFNYTKGKVYDKNNNQSPFDHIPPIYGVAGLKFEKKLYTLDFYMLYNGSKDLEDYSPSGEDNLQYAPVNGMPSWETFNFKGSLSIIHDLTLYAGVENLIDINYRTFASGINAPGRNIYIGAKYNFL